jgi:hypothetical protein
MRPHVELIQEEDYIWHPVELPGGEGKAVQRNLSVDEEDGSASMRVDFLSDWGRPAGFHHADVEFYVLEGEMRIGERALGQGGYLHAPKGVAIPQLRFKEGTRVLHYREYGDWGFEEATEDRPEARGSLTVLDTESMTWEKVATPGPAPGLHIKLLHRDEETGFYTRLIWSEEGWTDHRLAHHPCYEEAYTLWGSMAYNFGRLDPGTYFFRPPWVKHGHFISEPPNGCAWLIRSDGTLVNLYTTNEKVIVEGTPENYNPQTQGPILSSNPVRSKATGAWDGDGM